MDNEYEYEYVSLTFNKDFLIEQLEDIDLLLIDERNKEIMQIHSDMVDLQETMKYINLMIVKDGEKLEEANNGLILTEQLVENGANNLEEANLWVKKTRALFRDIGIIAGGVIVGALGLAGGPVIGAITIALSTGITGGVVHNIRKYEKKHGTLTLRRIKRDDMVNKEKSSWFQENFPITYLKVKYLQIKYF